MDCAAELGRIDIYLLDQLLRGLVPAGARVLDAGCGGGRNLDYFLRNGFDVWAIDRDPGMVERAAARAAAAGAPHGPDRFRAEAIEATSLEDGSFDYVICNAVLHFANHEAHFDAMTQRLAALLAPGGIAFCRLGTTITLEGLIEPLPDRGPRWGRFPDGNCHFLADLDFLLARTAALGAELVDPIKTVNVQNRRCMTNWIWRRSG